MYGKDVLTVLECQNWLAKFLSGNFDVCTYIHKGVYLIQTGEQQLARSLRFQFVWVPHVFPEGNLCNCVDIWNLILKSQESDPLLTRSITGTKNGLSVTMSNARDTQVKKMYGLKAFEKSIFIKKRDVIYHND